MKAFATEYKEYKDYIDKEYIRRVPEFPLSKCMRRTGTPACIAVLLLVFFVWSPFGGAASTMKMFSSSNALFPRKVWQTWKVDPLDFAEKDLNIARSWPAKNPAFRYEVLTDTNDLAWVETTFGPNGFNRLDIVYMYRELTAKIIKADLLRYLVMYVEGGVYTDIDVEALKPVSHFIPERWDERNVDMVIGVEIDQPDYKEHPILGPKSQSFCQWTFMCKPRLRVMMDLIENIITWLNHVAAEQGVPISQIKLDFDQVISGTGPSAFTKAILADMSRRTGHDITWDIFHDLAESKMIGGVLVLTVEAFAAGQGHSDSGNHETKHAIVRHHYHASGWPTAHPRYKHPVLGQVEDCNWKHECVRKWDDDKAAFEALTPEEQAKQIEIHEAEVVAEEARVVEAKKAEEELARNKAAFDAASPEVQAMLDPAKLHAFGILPPKEGAPKVEEQRKAFGILPPKEDAPKVEEPPKADGFPAAEEAKHDLALHKRGLEDHDPEHATFRGPPIRHSWPVSQPIPTSLPKRPIHPMPTTLTSVPATPTLTSLPTKYAHEAVHEWHTQTHDWPVSEPRETSRPWQTSKPTGPWQGHGAAGNREHDRPSW